MSSSQPDYKKYFTYTLMATYFGATISYLGYKSVTGIMSKMETVPKSKIDLVKDKFMSTATNQAIMDDLFLVGKLHIQRDGSLEYNDWERVYRVI